MSIQGEIDRLSAAKASIAASLQAMGIEPPEGTTLEQYAAQLAAIATAAPWLSIPGGGTMQMGESLGEGPYTIEVTEDGEGGGLSAEYVGYSNTGSGLEATNVQGAIDELAKKSGGEYLSLAGGTMTGPLALSGNPTNGSHAANKQYVDTSIEHALSSIGYSLLKEYTSPGSYTYTFSRKYTDVFVVVVGGGGGGGSLCQNGFSGANNSGGGGGGAGGFVACFHILDSTKIQNRNIVVGTGGAGAPAQSERGATGNGGNGSSSSAFGVTVPGGKGGQGATGGFNEAPNAVGVYSIAAGGNGANGYDQSDRRGNNGPIVDILGLTFFSGGGGGGGGAKRGGSRPAGGAGGANGGGAGGSGATDGADGTNGSAGSKGGGGGGAGGGFYSGDSQKSGIGGKGGNGYVAIYAKV